MHPCMLITILSVLLNLSTPATVAAPAPTSEAAIWLDAVAHDLPAIKDSAPTVEDIDSDSDDGDEVSCAQW